MAHSEAQGSHGRPDQARRGKIVLYVISPLHSPHILAVQEVENLGVLEDLGAAIRFADRPDDLPCLVEGNDRGSTSATCNHDGWWYGSGAINRYSPTTSKPAWRPGRPPFKNPENKVKAENTRSQRDRSFDSS